MPVKAKNIKDLPLKEVLDGSESLLVQDSNGTKQAPLEVIVDEIKQNSQEKIREISDVINENVIFIKKFGAKGDGVTDDTEVFQRAFDKAREVGGTSIYIEQGDYRITNTLKMYGCLTTLVGLNTPKITLDTLNDSLPLLRVIDETASSSASGADTTCNYISGIKFTAKNSRTGYGVVFGDDKDAPTDYTSRDIMIRDCAIANFNVGMDFRKNAYILTIDHASLGSCNTCVQMLNGFSNYGERIVFTNTTLCNSTMLVRMKNGEGALYFNNCSFDYSTQFIECTSGNIYINQGHLEFRHGSEKDWLIYCGGTGGQGAIIIRDSLLICTTPNNPTYEYLFWCDSGDTWKDSRFEISVIDCRIIHWKSKSGFLCGGNDWGRFFIRNSLCHQIPSIHFKTKANQNLSDRLTVLEYDESKASYEFITDTDHEGNDRTVLKITKLNYLGHPCIVECGIPNIISSLNVLFYVRGNTSSACWLNAGYKYSLSGKGYDVSEIAIGDTYAKHSTGYFFPLNRNIDDYVLRLDLNNAGQNESVYIYIDGAYEF